MPLFHRRTVQRMLCELQSGHLPKEQVESWVRKLNNGPVLAALGAEWEVVVTHAFCQLGKTQVEESHGTRKPDLVFWGHEDRPVFVADLCCLSGAHLENTNPINAFSESLHNIIEKEGLRSELFGFRVDKSAAPSNYYPDRKHYRDRPPIKLLLPPEHQFKRWIFNKDFYAFLSRIRLNPSDGHELHILNERASVRLSYEPGQRYLSGGYPSFYETTELTRNPIYRALKRKAKQLKESCFECAKGIVVCDGGYPLLSQTFSSPLSYSVKDILIQFLHDNSSIDVVVVLSAETNHQGGLFLRRKAVSQCGLDALPSNIGETLSNMCDLLPSPVRSARNAALAWEHRSHNSATFLCNTIRYWPMKISVQVSAQSLLKLMAGRVALEDLFQKLPHQKQGNEFESALAQGYTITGVQFEKNPDEDDDWIHLELSGPDASVGPFHP